MQSNEEYIKAIMQSTVTRFEVICVEALEKHLNRKSTTEDFKECTLVYNANKVYTSFDEKETLLYYKTILLGRIIETVTPNTDLQKNVFRIESNLKFIPEDI